MNSVEQIHTALTDLAVTELGPTWQKLRKIWEPQQNDFRNIELGFAWRHGPATPDEDATKVFVLRQTFDLVLTHRAANRDNDQDIQVRLNNLYSKADDVFKKIVRDRLGLSFVTHIDGIQYQQPTVLENGAVVLVGALDVHYFVDPY
jgi:hypothetical protein